MDAAYARTLGGVYASLAPGGHFIFAEIATKADRSKGRSGLSSYRLRSASLPIATQKCSERTGVYHTIDGACWLRERAAWPWTPPVRYAVYP